jgi:transcriptional regulator with XRE-family HTH domain
MRKEVNCVSNIGERIKELRKALKLSQTEFGVNIGVGLGVVRNLESSITLPSPAQIDLIVRVFNVNRAWLETGEGEMLAEMSRAEKIGRFVADVLEDEPDSFRRKLIDILIELDADGWQKLKEAADVLSDLNE